jgi:hypothetical protein
MKFAWLMNRMLECSYGKTHPSEIHMGTEAFNEYQNLLGKLDPPDLGYARYRFHGAEVKCVFSLKPRTVRFVINFDFEVPEEPTLQDPPSGYRRCFVGEEQSHVPSQEACCPACGGIMVRTTEGDGSCWVCSNCREKSGKA